MDYVIHLGDYIYEYKNGDYGWGQSIGRVPLPDKEIYSLYDYRKRIATYRTDLDLLASHQQFPWITVWDDHDKSAPASRILITNILTLPQRFQIIPTVMARLS